MFIFSYRSLGLKFMVKNHQELRSQHTSKMPEKLSPAQRDFILKRLQNTIQ